MRRPVAGEATKAIGRQVFGCCLMNRLSLELLRPSMTRQTVGVGKGAVVPNGLCPRSRHVEPPVAQTVQLGLEGAVYPIGGVTGVALVVRDPFVGVVFSRQSGALRIVQ